MSGDVTYDFTGRVALVTGAAGDIGRAVSVRLAAAGADVALADLAAAGAGLQKTAELCDRGSGAGRTLSVVLDVTDPASVTDAVATVGRELGVPQLVVNNAGVQGAFTSVADYPLDDARRVLDVNVIGVLTVLQAVVRSMREAGLHGSVVNTASMAGVAGAANMVAYSASKGAVISLTRSAAKDLAPLGIRVNSISPAFIGPGVMWDRQVRLQAAAGSRYFSADPDEVARQFVDQVPLGRAGSADEVASAALWLLSTGASYVTGENVLVTGGLV